MTKLKHIMNRFSRWHLLWIIVVAFSMFLKTYYIHAIPSVISHDEIYYPSEAKAISLSGHDTSGTWSPTQLKPANPLFAELPGTFMVPAQWLFPRDPILAAKATSMVMGTVLSLVIGLFIYQSTRSHLAGLMAVAIASLNPWIFQFSRMIFDSLFSLTFYLWGIYSWHYAKKNWKLSSLLLFFLGFYMYQGLKVVFLPLIIITYLLRPSKANKDTNKIHWIILGLSSLIFVSFFIRLAISGGTDRTQELIFTNKSWITAGADKLKQFTLENPLKVVLTSKPFYIGKKFIEHYLEVFNPTKLFITGEPGRNPFSVYSWGIFMPLDLLAIVIALFWGLKDKKTNQLVKLALLMALLAPLPSAINTNGSWIMFRASLIVPAVLLLVSVGFWQLLKHHKVIFIGFSIGYVAFAGVFLHEYFFHYPIIGSKDKYFAEHIVSNYASRLPESKTILVLVNESKFMFETYLVFNNLITKNNLSNINQAIQTNTYKLNNVTVASDCISQSTLDNYDVILYDSITVQACDNSIKDKLANTPHRYIKSMLDGGERISILKDSLCSSDILSVFPQPKSISDFNVGSLTTNDFCRLYINAQR